MLTLASLHRSVFVEMTVERTGHLLGATLLLATIGDMRRQTLRDFHVLDIFEPGLDAHEGGGQSSVGGGERRASRCSLH